MELTGHDLTIDTELLQKISRHERIQYAGVIGMGGFGRIRDLGVKNLGEGSKYWVMPASALRTMMYCEVGRGCFDF